MVAVQLKGVHKVTTTRGDGKTTVYYYAWRGGPRLKGLPGSTEFIASHAEAINGRSLPNPKSFSALIVAYKASQDYQGLNPATRKNYGRYLDMIREEFGAAPLAVMDDKRMRRHVKAWRDAMAANPRKADMAAAILRRVLSFGVDNGDMTMNVASRLKRLHKSDRSKEIWEPQEIEAFCAHASPALQRAMHLARFTGLRRGDLVHLPWSAFHGTHIDWTTSKRGRRVIVPLTPAARALIAATPKLGPTLLTGQKGRPWTPDGLSTVEGKARRKAGVSKRWHDLRGNAATELALAGLDDREIAEIIGWSVSDIANIRRLYVDRETIISAAIARLNRNESGTSV